MNRYAIVGVLLLLAAGCASTPPTPSDELRDAAGALRAAVERSVDDPQRRARALELVHQLDYELRALGRANQAVEIQSGQLFADYDATKKEFEQLLASAQSGRERVRKRLIDLRLALAALLTAAEWQAVVDADTEALGGWAKDAG